jgi:hypothetical protein
MMPSKKLIFNTIFSAYYFFKVNLHHFSKIKSQKESQNSRNQGFCYYFCMMIEGSGSIPLTNGSGSGRPKNMWIRWIRIRNTDYLSYFFCAVMYDRKIYWILVPTVRVVTIVILYSVLRIRIPGRCPLMIISRALF